MLKTRTRMKRSNAPLRHMLIVLFALFVIAPPLQAQTYEVLVDLGEPSGQEPSSLIQAQNGELYGTTTKGGVGHGTIFHVDSGGRVVTVFLFNGPNGSAPRGALTSASDGHLYGVTTAGGASGKGTVFRYEIAADRLTTLASFNGTNGANPMGGLAEGLDGFLYGTASAGGSSGAGTLFKVAKNGSGFSVLRTFSGINGRMPFGGVVLGPDGRIYGTTFQGGTSAYGTVFAIDAAGVFTKLVDFNNTGNGANPWSALTTGRDGYIYGTTYVGGANRAGTVFRLSTGGVLTTIKTFSTSGGGPAYVRGGVVQGGDGKLYGTSYLGGNGYGTVFRLGLDGTLTLLRSFVQSDGAYADATLVPLASGNICGVLPSYGPVGSSGTLFDISPVGSFSLVHAFKGSPISPRSALTQGTNGRLYATSVLGGGAGVGTAFSVDSSGTLELLAAFSIPIGANPYGGVIQASDGNFYGTANRGGAYDLGAVFKATSAGQTSTIYSFPSTGGYLPRSWLVEGPDGALYGTTLNGGAYGKGTVFRVTRTGTYATLASFRGTDGQNPYAGLTVGPDGRLYGTTTAGGANAAGTLFALTLSGTLTRLYSFGGTTGTTPYGGVTLGPDGRWYGTTLGGGASNRGAIFRYDPATGVVQAVHSFTGSNGQNPEAGLMTASNGALYGTATYGGAYGKGTIYRFDPNNGGFALLHSFRGSDGAAPRAALFEGRDGLLYGTASEGGAGNNGVIFRIGTGGSSVPPPAAATIKVTAPNTNVNWGIGSTQILKWTHDMGAGAPVRIEVSYNGGQSWTVLTAQFSSQTAIAGSFNWKVTGPATQQARIRVSALNGATSDTSDTNFTIAAPYVQVVKPNAPTDVWTVGTKGAITWKDNLGNKLDKVKIELSSNGGVTWTTLASATPADGSHSVTVQNSWISSVAKVRITWIGNTGVLDTTDTTFAIR